MFLRILGGLVLLLALLWVVMYASGAAAMRDAQREPWPYGLGTLEQLSAVTSPPVASPQAKEIVRLLADLDPDGGPAQNYVAMQTEKRDDAIDPPPPNAGLAEGPLAEIVRTAVSAGDRLVWGPIDIEWRDDLPARLAADALDHARRGDAAGAWERVHAMWLLARSFESDRSSGAEMALKLARAANAVARKLPPPVPPWIAELSAIEPRRETAAMLQQMVLGRLHGESELRGPFIVFLPLSDWFDASEARRDRASAEAMQSSPRCRIDTTRDLGHADDIYRAARIEAELEATAKVLALKAERARLGRWPPILADAGASRCADNHWIYSVAPGGGSMTLHMSWEVAAEPHAEHAYALRFSY